MLCGGVVYVALSQVRTLAGVHIISFDEAKVCADARVGSFYDSLQSTGDEFADCLMHVDADSLVTFEPNECVASFETLLPL